MLTSHELSLEGPERGTMEEPPGRRAKVGQSARFTDGELAAARLAKGPVWAVIALGIGLILFGGMFFAVKHSGNDVVATVIHQGPCSGACTVRVVYHSDIGQVTTVMKGVPISDIYGPPSHRLLNINYDPGDESDPTTNDMPDAVWIGFLAGGLAVLGWGIWWRRWQKAYARELAAAAAGGAPADAVIADSVTPALRDQSGLGSVVRIAERGPRWTAMMLSVFVAVLLVAFAQGYRMPMPVMIGAYLLVAVLGVWAVVRGWRIALLAGPDLLTVRNHFRTYRLGWHDVAEFSDGRMSGGEAGTMWALRILRNDGRAVTSQATARVRRARPSTAETIVEIARQHGIAESLTGRPARRKPQPPRSATDVLALDVRPDEDKG